MVLLLVRTLVLECGCCQTQPTKKWVFAKSNKLKFGYWPDQLDRNVGIGPTEQIKNCCWSDGRWD